MRKQILIVIAALCVASPAVAQSAQSAPPSRPVQRDVYRYSPLDLDQASTHRTTGSARRLAGQSRERIQLANRLARMANGGDCAGAIRGALDAGDSVIAQRLYEACRRPETQS